MGAAGPSHLAFRLPAFRISHLASRISHFAFRISHPAFRIPRFASRVWHRLTQTSFYGNKLSFSLLHNSNGLNKEFLKKPQLPNFAVSISPMPSAGRSAESDAKLRVMRKMHCGMRNKYFMCFLFHPLLRSHASTQTSEPWSETEMNEDNIENPGFIVLEKKLIPTLPRSDGVCLAKKLNSWNLREVVNFLQGDVWSHSYLVLSPPSLP